jgi:magnesium transporter
MTVLGLQCSFAGLRVQHGLVGSRRSCTSPGPALDFTWPAARESDAFPSSASASEEPVVPDQVVEQILSALDEEGRPRNPPALSHLLAECRPEDLAAVLSEFAPKQLVTIFRHLDDLSMAEVLDETDPTTREELLGLLDSEALGQIVEIMPPDEGADLMEALKPTERAEILQQVEPQHARHVRELLRYDAETAGGIMTPHVAMAREDTTAGEALRLLQGDPNLEFFQYVYVVDAERRLKGVVSIRTLLRAAPARPVRALMESEPIAVEVSTDQEEVARVVDRYNLQAVPVLEKGVLRGIATIDDVVDVMVEEASEDIYRISGSSDLHPTKVPILSLFRLRIPWLLIPLIGGLAVAVMQSQFEDSLRGDLVILLFFTPAVIGLSGGVGLQSSTTVVRGIATGEIDIERIVPVALKEVGVGLVIAAGCGLLSALAVWLVVSTSLLPTDVSAWRVSVAVTCGVVAGMIMGAVTGTIIPLVCQRLGVDPALVAGPFTTTMNDVVGSSCYLVIAIGILSWL